MPRQTLATAMELDRQSRAAIYHHDGEVGAQEAEQLSYAWVVLVLTSVVMRRQA